MKDIAKRVIFNKSNLPTISVCLIVKNEGKNLEELLPILVDVIDEIVIIDTGSTDNTKEITLKYTNKIYDFPWINDFSAARNESIKNASKDYILWLDADDRLDKQDIIKLKMHLFANKNTGVYLQLEDRQPGKTLTSLQLRLFPNIPGVCFKYRVHEQVSFSLKDLKIKSSIFPIKITHIGYKTPEIMMDKLKRNIELLKEDVITNPDDFLINLEIGKAYIGYEDYKQALVYIDKAISVINEKEKQISTENYFYAYISKITILLLDGLIQESIKILEEKRYLFHSLPIYRLTLGEIYFKQKDYLKAYKDLLILKAPMIPTTLALPLESLTEALFKLFFVCCIYVKDKESIEYCIKQFLKFQVNLPEDWN